MNATIDSEAGTITYADGEHLGIAVDTEKGLMVPVVKDAGDLSVSGLAKKIGDLAARSRASKVAPDELSGGTFTITNLARPGRCSTPRSSTSPRSPSSAPARW